jgi:hypothetical protein
MKTLILFLSILLGFSSCAPKPKQIIWEKTEEFKIVRINPPKHFYLDLQRVSDGEVFKSVYISKRCGGMCIQEGDVITVTYGKYKRGDDEWEEFDRVGIIALVCGCR